MSKVTISAALKKVNDARLALGFEPLDKMPKGILSRVDDCPVHNALGFHENVVTPEAVYVTSRQKARTLSKVWGTDYCDVLGDLCEDDPYRWSIRNPREIHDFIVKFDQRGFKTLIKPDPDED